ncbi:MAG: cellulose-binding protein CttA-related protein, partial [Ruminococcus sp.]|nr:cellulose-binding protein CttA-related protein [Ruminococcus sp.]
TTTEEPVDGTTTTTTTEEPIDGSTTTTTTTTEGPTIVSAYVSEVETVTGYYFSHDPREFAASDLISSLTVVFVYSDGSEAAVDLAEYADFGGATPESTYEGENTTFKYEVPIYISEFSDYVLTDADGNAVTATVYIGVKGDADLSNVVDSVDASYVLSYYAKEQTSATQDKSIKLTQDDEDLDKLAAFLADIDVYESDSENITRDKTSRHLDAIDASHMLVYYSKQQTSTDSSYDIWNSIVPEFMIQR